MVLDSNEIGFKHRTVKIVDILALNRPVSCRVGESKINNVSLAKWHVLILEKDGTEEVSKWLTPYLAVIVSELFEFGLHVCIHVLVRDCVAQQVEEVGGPIICERHGAAGSLRF
jgi:hypothetical protein